MTVYVCSLITAQPQEIAPAAYRIVRFPFGASGESFDQYGMHQAEQPDGAIALSSDDRAGLIWPSQHGWASLTAMIFWESGDYTELRDRFVRDPLNITTGFDSTATEDRPPTPGGQYLHKCHELFVYPGTPIALMVQHNDTESRLITHAEFKLAIHPS